MRRMAVLFVLATSLWGCDSGLWLTSDQKGQRLMRSGEYGEAARKFTDPLRRGTALYRAGEFEAAAAAFSPADLADAHFNRGNSLVMLGKYLDAVSAYDRALERRPHWKEAEENREIARIRAQRMEVQGGDMTGGMLGADEIVLSENGDSGSDGEKVVREDREQPLSDEQLRELWLRRVQTSPADFLRSKFAHQHANEKRDR